MAQRWQSRAEWPKGRGCNLLSLPLSSPSPVQFTTLFFFFLCISGDQTQEFARNYIPGSFSFFYFEVVSH